MSKKKQNRPGNVNIKLTKKQIEQLQPHFDYATNQYNKGAPGVIFGQPKQCKEDGIPDDYVMTCGFIPHPFAKKIVGVSKRASLITPKL